nr:hypothetical protein Iba_chr07aCG6720 [Ipomoea batatas]
MAIKETWTAYSGRNTYRRGGGGVRLAGGRRWRSRDLRSPVVATCGGRWSRSATVADVAAGGRAISPDDGEEGAVAGGGCQPERRLWRAVAAAVEGGGCGCGGRWLWLELSVAFGGAFDLGCNGAVRSEWFGRWGL